jgi:hypothetical protein
MCRASARRLSIYNFAWGLLKASNLQAESKILKEIIGTPNLSLKKKNLKITVSRTLKVEKGQNPKKIIRTSNQPIRTKFFQKKDV